MLVWRHFNHITVKCKSTNGAGERCLGSSLVTRTEHFMDKYHLKEQNLFFKNMIYRIALSSGAGSEYRGQGGGFLRANAAVCVQRDRHVFPPRPLLHLPEPADFTSAPPQDRSRLIRWRPSGTSDIWNPPAGRKEARNEEKERTSLPFKLRTLGICSWDSITVIFEAAISVANAQGFPNALTTPFLFLQEAHYGRSLEETGKTGGCLNNEAYLAYFPTG